MPSKLITDRQKSASSVVHAGTTNAAAIGDAFAKRYAAQLQKGEKMPDFALVVELAVRELRGRVATLVATDKAHDTELSDNLAPREARDLAATALRNELITYRGVLGSGYGTKSERDAGFVGEVPVDPVVLARFGGEVAGKLRHIKLPKARVKGVAVAGAELADRIEALVKELEGHVQDVAREAKEAQVTLSAKNNAIAAYDEQFGLTARLVEIGLAGAGKPDLADKVRPSARRPGVTREGEEGGDTPPADAAKNGK